MRLDTDYAKSCLREYYLFTNLSDYKISGISEETENAIYNYMQLCINQIPDLARLHEDEECPLCSPDNYDRAYPNLYGIFKQIFPIIFGMIGGNQLVSSYKDQTHVVQMDTYFEDIERQIEFNKAYNSRPYELLQFTNEDIENYKTTVPLNVKYLASLYILVQNLMDCVPNSLTSYISNSAQDAFLEELCVNFPEIDKTLKSFLNNIQNIYDLCEGMVEGQFDMYDLDAHEVQFSLENIMLNILNTYNYDGIVFINLDNKKRTPEELITELRGIDREILKTVPNTMDYSYDEQYNYECSCGGVGCVMCEPEYFGIFGAR